MTHVHPKPMPNWKADTPYASILHLLDADAD
jgi:hypothetical protein